LTSRTAGTDGSLALAQEPGDRAPAQSTRPHLVVTPAEPARATQQPAPAEASASVAPEDAAASLAERKPAEAPVSAAVLTEAQPTATAGHGAGVDLAAMQSSLAAALAAAKGHQSASEQIEDAIFSVEGDVLSIQTTLSKTMLPVVINAEAERILQAALRDCSTGRPAMLRLKLLPGVAAPRNAAPKARAAAAGSAAELAEKHPIVQQAKRIFSADISNVIDLRGKS
jgi:DNA polymerase-3 subunit gamma/tau